MTDQGRLAAARAMVEEIRSRNRLVSDDDPRKVLLSHLDWLLGEVERLRGLLRQLEWAEGYEGQRYCLACGGGDHAPDCWLAAALA